MEQKTVREWKSVACPDGKAQSMVMFEWDILSEMDRIVKTTLRQMDCHNPRLTEFGGTDCNWVCQKTTAKEETAKSRTELLLVCAVLVSAFLWIVFYALYLKPFLHLYGLAVFFGLPLLIILLLFYTWKMMRHILRADTDPLDFQGGSFGPPILNS